ncbi:tetratricopeptide repeat protein [Marixanthomonas spongiae]|uniref:tetratricopeptide repeat protein n=1 Tax=Marixanthomonas spongiae TaxID=2174845 RepID=UPI001403B9F5|nr:tetratricopeptide repeat protein [Marixanthomonas spongiae]
MQKLELQASKMLFRKPDSAKISLLKLLEYSNQRHDTAVAKTYSNLGITYNQLAKYDSATQYFKKAIELTKDYPLQQAGIYSNLAINYRITSDYEKSLASLDTAMQIYRQENDLNGKGLVYGEMASNYSYMQKKEKAIVYLKKAIKIFKETEDPRLYILQQKLANAYYNNEEYVFAVDLYEQILPTFAKKKEASYYFTLLAYAESLMHLGKPEAAEKRLQEAKEGFEQINNREYKYVAMGKLGKIYNATGRPALGLKALREAYQYLLKVDSTRFLEIASAYLDALNNTEDFTTALEVIRQVKEETKDFKHKMNAQDELKFLLYARETYRKTQRYPQALKVYDRVDFLKDSIRNAVDAVKIKQLEAAYQNDIQREKNIVLEENNTLLQQNSEKQKKLTILSLVFIIVLIGLLVVIYRYHRKQLSLHRESMANLERSNVILKEKQDLEHALLAEKEENLGDKERELVAITLEAADTQNKIVNLLESSKTDEISNELSAKIMGILNRKNYWKHFKTKFVEVHPEFGQKLSNTFPNLSENDIAFCSLLKLQLTNKEIASLLGISHQSVISKKYRIKKKMKLDKEDQNFEQIIRDL